MLKNNDLNFDKVDKNHQKYLGVISFNKVIRLDLSIYIMQFNLYFKSEQYSLSYIVWHHKLICKKSIKLGFPK
jgi:hypothetical protein